MSSGNALESSRPNVTATLDYPSVQLSGEAVSVSDIADEFVTESGMALKSSPWLGSSRDMLEQRLPEMDPVGALEGD